MDANNININTLSSRSDDVLSKSLGFDELPDETLFNILLETDDLDTLSSWCRTSKRINNICQDEVLWKRKYQKDFGFSTRGSWGLSGEAILIKGLTWREQYKFMFSGGKNSPISATGYKAGAGKYGVINTNGYLYMTKNRFSSESSFSHDLHSVKFPSVMQTKSLDFLQPKIISISFGEPLIGAVTENGKAYVWNYVSVGYQEGDIVVDSSKEINLPVGTKAVRIEVSSLGYMILLEDYSVYLQMYKEDKINISGILKLKIIDISIGSNIYTVITKNNGLFVGGDIFRNKLNTKNLLSPLKFPGPVVRAVVTREYIMALTITGKVYTWRYKSGVISSDTIFDDTQPVLVLLPEPILRISTNNLTFAAISSTDKLYMWGGKADDYNGFSKLRRKGYSLKPVEILLREPVYFISVGGDFTVSMSNKGTINYWDHPA